MEQLKNQIELPLTVFNAPDDYITFVRYYKNESGQPAVEVDNKVPPKGGPPMHIHHKAKECLTVLAGTMGIKEPGKPERFITVGETVLWEAGVAHKFWNAGTDTLHCTGWVAPVDSFVFLLSEIHKSVYAGNGRPSMFDIAFLMRRYKPEFYMTEIPALVQATYFPLLVWMGGLLGKYDKYANAPHPHQ